MQDTGSESVDLRGHARTFVQTAVLAVMLVVVSVGVLLSWGQGGALPDRVLGVLATLAASIWAPLLYLLGALGLGRLTRVWTGGAHARWAIELGSGLTIVLTLSMLLGMSALLTPLSAWLMTGAGIALLSPDLARLRVKRFRYIGPYSLGVVLVPGTVLALLMACNPPGMQWGSEYGGFDALSYHLQLPREWIEQGRIWPNQHNVYSFLPGAIEGAYMHLALLAGGDMHTHDARAAMSAQMLSVLMLLCSAGVIASLARACMQRLMPDTDPRMPGMLAGALTLSTPWLLVVGTLAYNEIAVVLLGACALLAAMHTETPAWKRGVLCGLIVGGACSCKPTALFLLAPSVGIVLLACSARRQWIPVTLVCCVVGALTIAPWLIRNELATGNPVFPQMAGVFGLGHWSESQHAVYAAAHSFDGSVLDRFALLVVPDPGGVDHVSRFRGLTNAQWGLTPTLALIGLGTLLYRPTTRRYGWMSLVVVLIPIGCWALLTHVQSRFLIPLAPVLIVLGSVGVAQIHRALTRIIVSAGVAACSTLWCTGIALSQNGANPFQLVDLGPGVFLGTVEIGSPPWTAVLNGLSKEKDTVYLLGDATPYYVRGDVRYNTVYDRWLIEDAIRADPDAPHRWTQTLREHGIEVVVVSFSEIERYTRSGWLPESIDPDRFIAWIQSLGSPSEVWSNQATGVPIRAIFRLDTQPQ